MGDNLSIFRSRSRDAPSFANSTRSESFEPGIGTWNYSDIRRWLKNAKLEEDFAVAFQSRRITGSQLMKFTSYNQIDEQFKPFPTHKKKALWKHIEKLKHDHPCLMDLPNLIKEDESPSMLRAQHMVLAKLNKLRGFHRLSEEDKVEKARNLFVADRMLRTYLSEDFIGTYKVMDDLFLKGGASEKEKKEEPALANVDVDGQPAEDLSTNEDNLESPDEDDKPAEIIAEDTHESAATMDSSSLSQQEDKPGEADYDSDSSIPQIDQLSTELDKENNPHYNLAEKRLKIKLVIVEIHQNYRERAFRKFLSPVMDKFRLAPTFGIFHSAIIIGPFYLEFNDSGLCIPRKCCSNAAIIAADMSAEFSGPSITVALDRISKIICHWNANVTYSSKKNNCQSFVEELCKGLGIDVAKQTENATGLGHFFTELRAYGKCDLKYVVSDELMEKCGSWMKDDKNIHGRYVSFKTHQQLDEFVTKINTSTDYMYFQFTPQGKDDWVLLKSFDRAFWLRHFKNADEEQFKPCSCPFGDPRTSGSIVSSWFAV